MISPEHWLHWVREHSGGPWGIVWAIAGAVIGVLHPNQPAARAD